MKKDHHTTNIGKYLIGGLIAIVMLLIAFTWIVKLVYPELSDRGVFGDQFGFVNALFSGMAFLGLILTIAFQTRDLKLQTEALQLQIQEFKEQKDEMKRSAQAQEHANLLARRKMKMDILKARIEFHRTLYESSSPTSPQRSASSNRVKELINEMSELVESALIQPNGDHSDPTTKA